MQLNIKKIDERIQKLQEIKRIASDPELVAMLLEFIGAEDDRRETAPAAKVEAASASNGDDDDLVKKILTGADAPGSGLWSRKRSV
jgi:hypothetical protein